MSTASVAWHFAFQLEEPTMIHVNPLDAFAQDERHDESPRAVRPFG